MSHPFRRTAHWKMPLPNATTSFVPERWTRQIRRASRRALEYLAVAREFRLPRRIARAVARVRAARQFQAQSKGVTK